MYCNDCQGVVITLSRLEGFVALYNRYTFGNRFDCLKYWKEELESLEGCPEFLLKVSALYGMLSCFVLDKICESSVVDMREEISTEIFLLKATCIGNKI